jgi:hypothetical protein
MINVYIFLSIKKIMDSNLEAFFFQPGKDKNLIIAGSW